jgi:hypothetical protein
VVLLLLFLLRLVVEGMSRKRAAVMLGRPGREVVVEVVIVNQLLAGKKTKTEKMKKKERKLRSCRDKYKRNEFLFAHTFHIFEFPLLLFCYL